MLAIQKPHSTWSAAGSLIVPPPGLTAGRFLGPCDPFGLHWPQLNTSWSLIHNYLAGDATCRPYVHCRPALRGAVRSLWSQLNTSLRGHVQSNSDAVRVALLHAHARERTAHGASREGWGCDPGDEERGAAGS